ncbi:DUF397 domain-containing protein [Kibdelosporangium phytohabitans]|uniref:DUF397 domain-containing protein n=1 Tax=Kibdelosporangium phytohabitans TaxID=860235 RepID=UPI0009F8A3FE|nr:DUF397 domain-containing protein [Kibdelosporangium phytohabitans]MBE1462813.1 hypothetical protein [Kibdelosporangium phytohabitans]
MDQHWSTWKKSSFSGYEGNECVEVAPWGEVRDSKNPNASLSIPTTSWRVFTATLQ